MDLLPNESVLHELPNLVLTNYRIRKFSDRRNGVASGREIVSIRLEQITHCQTRAIDSPALIVIGSLFFLSAFICGVATRLPFLGWMGFIAFIAYAIAYLVINRCELVVAAPSITIKQTLPAKSFSDAIKFINRLEREMAAKPSQAQSEVKREIVREIVYAPSVVEKDEETKERIVLVRPNKERAREPARAREEVDYWGG